MERDPMVDFDAYLAGLAAQVRAARRCSAVFGVLGLLVLVVSVVRLAGWL